jgi:hypothetical protein
LFFFDAIDLQCGPGLNRGIDIAEIPFIGGQLTVRFHIPFPHNQQELVFGKAGINQGHGNALKSHIPCRVPGVFPFIGHGNDVLIFKMLPIVISSLFSSGIRGTDPIPIAQPFLHIKIIELFVPKKTGQCLTLYC